MHHELVRVDDVALLVLERAGAQHVDGLVVQLDGDLGLFVAQLANVPVGVQQAQVDDAHVLAEAFDLLDVPQRERVVVAVGEHERVGLQARQHVVGVVARDEVLAAVARVPQVGHEQERLRREQRRGRDGGQLLLPLRLERLAHPLHQPRHAESDPHGVGVETALEEVVAVAHLVIGEVEEHDHAGGGQSQEREREQE